MSIKKHHIIITLLLVLLGFYIYSIYNNAKQQTDRNYLELWVAPNANEMKFWTTVVGEWNSEHLGMPIHFEEIPQSVSSEQAILSSLAGKTNPDMSSNIFSAFGEQLASLGAVYDLSQFQGFNQLVDQDDMQSIVKSWSVNGANYVFPMYSNPVLIWWRKDLLAKYGFSAPPTTYSQLLALAKVATIPNQQYAIRLINGNTWDSRWYDFVSYYYAASNGAPYIQNNQASFNNAYGKTVLDFFNTVMRNNWMLPPSVSNGSIFAGNVIGEIHGPWDISFAQVQYPNVYKNIEVGPILVPDGHTGPVYTYADTKGLVIFKSSKHPQEAWKFIQWVYSNPQFAKLWLEDTQMTPARGDLLTNPIFKSYLAQNPMVAQYAKYVATAVPTAPVLNTIGSLQAITDNVVQPLMFGKVTVNQALINGTKKVNSAIKDGSF